jgi:hypothetical protein
LKAESTDLEARVPLGIYVVSSNVRIILLAIPDPTDAGVIRKVVATNPILPSFYYAPPFLPNAEL